MRLGCVWINKLFNYEEEEGQEIKDMIMNFRNSWLLNKFSLLAPKEMYVEQYQEYE